MGEAEHRVITSQAPFDYAAQPKEWLAACNLCQGTEFTRIAEVDRYGFPQGAEKCETCSLVFLNPRLTKEAYARFYESVYRPLVSAYHGRRIDAETLQPEQREYGRKLAETLEAWMKAEYRTLLDVGGSTGVVARVLGERFDLAAAVLDPSPEELAEAAGLEVIGGFVEDYDTRRKFDVVTLCQAIDHLLDPLAALRKIHALLNRDGLLWVDILDYDKTDQIKVDHPFNFTLRTARAYLDASRFRVLQTSRDGDHVGFVCRPA